MRIANNRSEYLATVLVAGVALIMLVHFLRGSFDDSPAIRFALGIAPNFIASFSLPVVFISFKMRIGPLNEAFSDAAWFFCSTLLALAGVVAWEFRQIHLADFVYDPADIGASLLGAASFLCFWPIVRRFISAAKPKH